MNEAKIAVTIAALLITGAFGGYAFKNLETNDIVTEKITTVETVKEEVTPEEDKAEVETVELTNTNDDTEAKRIYLERSQSSIRSTVVHIESDDCVYADEEADDVQLIVEAESQASQAEVKNDESEAQATVEENSEASQNDETDDISIRYEYFNADASDSSSEDSFEGEDDSSIAEASETEDEFDADESFEDFESEELAEDEDSEEDIADSFSESTQEIQEAEDSVAEDNDDDMTDSEEEADDEDENSAEDEEASEDEEDADNSDDDEGEDESEEVETSTGLTVTQSEYYMLCNVVGHEYGSDWVSEYDKALVVEVIMNRVNSPKYPNSIYEVLTQPYQFSGMESYITLGGFSTQVTESVKAAVDLYLSDPSQFNHGYYSFWGDGYRNHFY